MSQEHPSSTPRRAFPKPVLAAFGSTGSLQRKNKTFYDKGGSNNNYTPETPLKTERSKFIIPSNLSPFALSPKLLSSRSFPVSKSTDLKNESFLNISLTSESFENSFLHSPSQFSSTNLNDSVDFPMDDEMSSQNFGSFMEKITNFCSDFEIDSSSVSPSVEGEITSEANFEIHSEPWKRSKVNFLNHWSLSENAFGNDLLKIPFLIYFSMLQLRGPMRSRGNFRLFR